LSSVFLLMICVALVEVLGRRAQRSESRAKAAEVEKPLGKKGAFQLILEDRYLLLIALLTVILNVVNTSGEYLFGRYVVDTAKTLYGSAPAAQGLRERFIGTTYSQLFSAVNLAGLLLQMFVVSRIFKLIGVGKALFIHPLIAGVGYLCMLRSPSLSLMRWLKIADNSLDYSLENTTKHALWLPTTREAKYKAKQVVDSFCNRAGDVILAGIVFAGEQLALSVPGFAALNVALVGVWLSVAAILNLNLRHKASEGKSAI